MEDEIPGNWLPTFLPGSPVSMGKFEKLQEWAMVYAKKDQ
jgi:hypothetical protein